MWKSDFAKGNNFLVTLAGNRTLAAPTNAVAGQSGSIYIIQVFVSRFSQVCHAET